LGSIALWEHHQLHPQHIFSTGLTVVALASFALSTTPDLRTNTDSLSDLEFGDFAADFDDFSDNLMPGDDELRLPGPPSAADGVVILVETIRDG
jgi:hypothetical protein